MTFLLILCHLASAPPVLPLSVATADDALAMFYNPAGLSTSRSFNIYYLYQLENWKISENSALAGQLGPLGFSWLPVTPFSYGLGLGFKLGGGIALGFRYFHQTNTYWCLGTLFRPRNWLSIGFTWPNINYEDWHAIIAGVGIRPVGNRLTVFTEVKFDSTKSPWFGLQFEPFSGIELKGMAKADKSFSLGIDISFGQIGIGYSNAKLIPNDNRIQHSVYLRFNKDIRPSVIPSKGNFLTMKLSGIIGDIKPGFSLFGPPVQRTTYEILDLLHKAQEDKEIKGVIVNLENLSLSFAQACELKEALVQLRTKGKKVIIYAPYLVTNTYYVAAVASFIVSHPLGYIDISGMYREVNFVKGTLEKLGVEVEYERVGKYKSAPELLTEDSLSSAYREVLNSILDDNYQYFITTTAQARGLSKAELEKKVNYGFFAPDSAKIEGLIDTFAYADQLDSILKSKFGKFKKITERSYRTKTKHNPNWTETASKIAIIYCLGSIVQGESRTDPISGEIIMGANTITQAIKKARRDRSVKAIIFRINSPGGDGFASDLIWREIELTKEKKPCIVSMGPVAASGGYYISCNSDKIFALPATLTGSIGVFSLKMVLAGLYDKIGVKTQVMKRGEHSDAFSPHRKLTTEEHQMLKKATQDFYHQFIQKVAKGRNKTYDYIDSIGQGRVWTGNQAKENGLVDTLGGLLAALDFAKQKAEAKEPKIIFLPKPKCDFLSPMLNWAWNRIFQFE